MTQALLSQMATRRAGTDVHEFDGMFQGINAHYKVTSVIGHVFRSYDVALFLGFSFVKFIEEMSMFFFFSVYTEVMMPPPPPK